MTISTEAREWHDTEVVTFGRIRDDLGELSNMHHEIPVTAAGVRMAASEHLYQCLKFPDDPELQRRLLDTQMAIPMKRLAQSARPGGTGRESAST